MDVANPSHFGTTTFGEPEVVELSFPGDPQRRLTATCARGEWRPPERLVQFVPAGFHIPIDCYTGPDGLRRIVPRCTFEELIDLGAVGGLAILHDLRGFDKQVDHSYRAMHLIHHYVRGRAHRGTRGMKEHLSRDFEHSRDLYIRRSGRIADGERNVLPSTLGLTAQGKGHRWSVTELTERGRQAARAAGFCNPTSKHAIAFGLWEAAKLHPVAVKAVDVPGLVQAALFEMDDSEDPPSLEFMNLVTERLLEAIQPHLSDSQEDFDRWFSPAAGSLVKQIAKQKRQPGGKLVHEYVRRVLLRLGWQASEYVGPCVHLLMQMIKNSLPEPLNDEERRRFEHMHENRPYYGNLPAALLAERMEFLRRAVLAIWDEPHNQEHIGALHRLLMCYVEMVDARRAADRQSKQRPHRGACGVDHATNIANNAMAEDSATSEESLGSEDGQVTPEVRAGGPVRLVDNLHFAVSGDTNPFAEVADHIRELQGIECPAGCTNWEYCLEGNAEDSVTIALRCECGQVRQKIQITRNEFSGHAQRLLK